MLVVVNGTVVFAVLSVLPLTPRFSIYYVTFCPSTSTEVERGFTYMLATDVGSRSLDSLLTDVFTEYYSGMTFVSSRLIPIS